MKTIRSVLPLVLALGAVTACSNPTTPSGTDSGGGLDGGGGGSDTGPMADTGARPDTNVDANAVTGGTCAMPIDLNTRGTALTTGTGFTIVADNTSAPAGAMTGLADGSCAMATGGGSNATNEMIFSYTVQTGGHLRASTAEPGTTANLDTIVWVLDACAATANELACNDDDADLTSVALTDTALTAGTTVYVVVAGYDGADVATGPFTLSVSELQPHGANEACDATNYFCIDGYTCLRDAAGSDTGHCLQDGGDNGLCRITMPYCDTGLQCSEAAPTADNTGVCQVPIATGDVCTDVHFVCVPGSTCQMDEGSMTMGHCLADGTEYGACHTTGMACDTGLTCSEAMPMAGTTGTCQTPLAGGDACTMRHSVCVTGFSCQLDEGSDTMGHCLADGAEYGLCRLTAPFCDGTLTCTAAAPVAGDGDTCQTPVAANDPCTSRHWLCVTGSHCIADTGSTTMGHCLVDGSMGAACRDAAPECDGTLTCDPLSGVCG